jgi:hypothetical protein
MAPAIDWLSCLQATFTPMSLSPSQPLMVHDLDYLRNMSQLVEELLLSHRFVQVGLERQGDKRRVSGHIGLRDKHHHG